MKKELWCCLVKFDPPYDGDQFREVYVKAESKEAAEQMVKETALSYSMKGNILRSWRPPA